MPDLIEHPTLVRPATEELRTAFPLLSDPRFDEHLVALDHGYSDNRASGGAHHSRPFRVLLLALLAVIFVLLFATAAAAAAWQMADERYVDEVIRDNL